LAIDYEVVEGCLRINCLNWAIAPSIEDSAAMMSIVVDKLLETKEADRIVLAEARENEYNVEQTKLLREIANAFNKIVNEYNLITLEKLAPPGYEDILPQRLAELQFLVLEVLRRDPIGAYVGVKRLIGQNKIAEEKNPNDISSYEYYINNALLPIKSILEQCQLIQKSLPHLHKFRPGNRDIYRDFFSPVIRPNFMLTRFMLDTPKEAKLIEKYRVGSTIVEILKVPNKVRYIYHVTPPEFVLTEDEYTILDSARRYLAAHKPTETENIEPERVRDYFKNLGIGLIKDLGKMNNVEFSSKNIEGLATILARYTAGFGVLELLLADEKIQDVFINSPIGFSPI